MMKTCIFLAALAVTTVSHAGDYDISANGNTRNGTLGQGQVDEGVVVNVRLVKVEPSNMAQATGTGIGAALGAAAGNQLGRNGGNYAATALAGVLGGVAGNIATDMIAQDTAQEVIIRKANGQMVVITQAESSLGVGQQVYLVDSAGKTRVIPR
ncbi:MAG: hypothetical protein WAX67_10480 [Rugosibacter sp.]